MTLRRATQADIPTLIALNDEVQGWHAATYPDRFKADVPHDHLRAFFARILEDADCLLWLAGNSAYLLAA